MNRNRSTFIRAVLAVAAIAACTGPLGAQMHPSARRSNARSQAVARVGAKLTGVARSHLQAPRPRAQAAQPGFMAATPIPGLAGTINYALGNYANSPVVRKFVDTLPMLNAPNNLGQQLPVAVPDTATFPGCDYYEIGLVQYTQKMHSDLPATTLRGYVQLNGPNAGVGATATPGVDASAWPVRPQYLGPVIVAQKDRAVRLLFRNLLPTGAGGNLFIPVDTTLMGAGVGPNGTTNYSQNRSTIHLHGGLTPWISDGTPHQWTAPAGEPAPSPDYERGASYQNVPDMWFDPLTKAVVPGASATAPTTANGTAVNDPGPGSYTIFYTNAQTARLMFYHDHAYGITRLNVYAGVAAGYLVTDAVEAALMNGTTIPGTTTVPSPGTLPLIQIPLVIEDKTYVNDAATPPPAGFTGVPTPLTSAVDPSWASSFGTAAAPGGGSLWFPHVYMPNQSPADPSGANNMGRWDYGPWFFPPWVRPGGAPVLQMPALSTTPEAFVDTPVVNGTAYPRISVPAGPVRLRILNACNDRYLNLQLYQATNSGVVGSIVPGAAGTGYVSPVVVFAPSVLGAPGFGATATATADPVTGAITSIMLTGGGAGYSQAAPPVVQILDAAGLGSGATATALVAANPYAATATYNPNTEVATVPANPAYPIAWPAAWLAKAGTRPDILDNRDGGVPDPRTRGPAWIQIGTEGGFLSAPALLTNTPVGYESNTRSITVLNVLEHTVYMGPAERVDAIVDFSHYAGKTLIMYNDAPAPNPGYDSRYDYFTGDLDQTSSGGAPSTMPGFGPNTRTVMQIYVDPTLFGSAAAPTSTAPPDDYNPAMLAALQTALPAANNSPNGSPTVSTTYQDAPIVPLGTYATIQATSLTFTDTNGLFGPKGATTTQPLQPKTIQELFDDYGRMNATLGVELPFTNGQNQTTIPLGYRDPVTDVIPAGGTQLWKITHNGVDTHAIHFHLVNVQLVNRVGWDGMIKPPLPEELGWKETIKMNPLEDVIVAMTAKMPPLPATIPLLPTSSRLIDPTMMAGAPLSVVNPADGNQLAVSNVMTDFGYEYVWHCHLLGHEENDMMRPLVVALPMSLTCPATVSTATPAGSCTAPVTAAQIGVATVGGGKAPITLTVTGIPGTVGAIAPAGIPATSNFPVGTTALTWTATDASPTPVTVVCFQQVTVTGSTAPTLVGVPANISVNNDPGLCSAVVSWAPITGTDPCGGTVNVVVTPASGSTFPIGTTGVTVVATGPTGLQATATFTVTVKDVQVPVIAGCPANVTVSTGPNAITCSAVATWVPPIATDNCPGVVMTSNYAPGATFPVGTTLVTYTATDASKNTTSCSFNVTVVNNTPPKVTCPANITANNDPGKCSAVVSWPTITGSSICGIPVSVKATPASGSVFPVGTTTVTVTATDSLSNQSTCSFTVTVKDNQAPTIICPPATPISASATTCQAAVPAVAATDNCSVSVTQTPAAGTMVGIGTTAITVVATDASGNVTTQSCNITVADLTAPAITASSSPTSSKITNSVNVNVTGTVADLCSGVNLSSGTYTVSNNRNSTTQSGTFTISSTGAYSIKLKLSATQNMTYTITVNARDNAGNAGKAQATFRVGTG